MMEKSIAFEGAGAQRAARAEKVTRALLDAYWETVEAIGRAEAAVIIASGGRRTLRRTEQQKKVA
jgi:regulator of protease activity HflC (stomatin/prohibitin superfamily)